MTNSIESEGHLTINLQQCLKDNKDCLKFDNKTDVNDKINRKKLELMFNGN